MLTNDENINAISNLAITDHLPADIIRSLWLIQSLNIQFNDKKDVLHHNIELLRTVSKFQALAAYSSAGRQISNNNNSNSNYNSDTGSDELDIDIDIDIDQWINSLSKFTLLENTKVRLFQKTRQLDSEIRRLHNESIREAIKLRLLLDSAKQLLNGFSYQLIQLVFARSWSREPLKCFILKGTNDSSEENLIELDYKNTYPNISTYNTPNKYESIMQETQCFQRRNNETAYNKFSDFDGEFKQLIKELIESKSAKKIKQDKDDFYRKQIVLSLMTKNDAFDRCFNLNNHYKPKVKLIIKAPSSNGSSSKRPLKFHRNPSTKSELELPLFSESDSEDSSTTPRVTTPKLKLTFKGANKDPKIIDSSDVAQSSSYSISDAEILSTNKSVKTSRTTTERTALEAESTQEVYRNDNQMIEEEEVYCICRTGSSGKMIGCDDDDCPYGGWFHYKCIGLKSSYSPPKNLKWYCPWCKPKHEKKLSTQDSAKVKSDPDFHNNEKLPDRATSSGSRRSSRFLAQQLPSKLSTVVQQIGNYSEDPDRLLRKPRKVLKHTVKKKDDQNPGGHVLRQILKSSIDTGDQRTSRHTSRPNSVGDEVPKERQRASKDLKVQSQASSPKVSRLLRQISSSYNPLLPIDQNPQSPKSKKRKQIAIQTESEKSNLNTKKQKKSSRLLQSLKPVNVGSSIFAVPEVSGERRLSRRQSERIAPTLANYGEVKLENAEDSKSKHVRSLRRRMRV